jgi:hypothetical protein
MLRGDQRVGLVIPPERRSENAVLILGLDVRPQIP